MHTSGTMVCRTENKLKPHIVLSFSSFGNLFLSQHPQTQSAHYYYFCSPALKKPPHMFFFIYLDFFDFKGKGALYSKPHQEYRGSV